MKKKIYNLLSNSKQVLFVLVLTVLWVTANSQSTYTFNYTGGQQTIALSAGSYSIQCWGAIGGWHANDQNNYRGKGGYSSGTLTLTTTTTLYISAGGAGGAQINSTVPGGWNGGGNGKYYTYAFNAGGGASHVATAAGVISSLATNTSAVLIVAGGGGGGSTGQTPGNGGGLNGGNGTRSGCTGGTQTSPGGSSITGGNATFGQGWDASLSGGSYGAGGGGWYGGGCESGGSGYIGGVSSATTAEFGQTAYVANPDVSGNGRVHITELCSFALIASSSGTAFPTTLCSGTTLTITTNAISNYSWSTGATTNSIVVAPTTNTLYTLTATSPSNCVASVNMSVIVSSGPPVLTLAATPASVCVGDSVKLNATGAVSYTWSNGVNNNQLFPPTQTTTYVVTGKNGCGTTTAAITVTALPLPVLISSTTQTVCSGSPLSLTVTGATNYTWSTSQSASVIVVAPTGPTTYSVVGKKGSCTNTNFYSVSTNTLPNVQLVGTSNTVCAGTSVTLTANGGANYTWTPSNLTGNPVSDTPTASINYQVGGSNSQGCRAFASFIVLVSPLPTITVNSSQPTVCPGGTAILNANGGHSYSWNTGAQTKTISVNPIVNTSYTVTGTFTNSGCQDEATFNITVDQPTLAMSPSQTVCPGTAITLTAGGTGAVWSNGATGFNVIVVSTPTMYTATAKVVTSNNLLCDATGTVDLGMYPKPVVVATASRTQICRNEKTTLTASGADTYLWMNNGQTGSTQTFSSNVVSTHTINVKGTDVNGCLDTASVTVKVNACLGLEDGRRSEVSIYPNPTNGKFTVKSENDAVLQVLNELGQLLRVIELNSQNQHQANVSDLQKGVYFLQGKTADETIKHKLIVE